MSYQRQARQDSGGAGAAVVNLRAVDAGSPPRE
jgi:hypothetical protein